MTADREKVKARYKAEINLLTKEQLQEALLKCRMAHTSFFRVSQAWLESDE